MARRCAGDVSNEILVEAGQRSCTGLVEVRMAALLKSV